MVPGSSLRVLLVEDDERVRRTLHRLLERSGCRVTAADSVPAACDWIDAATFDVIVCDYHLGFRTGTEVAAAARRRWPGVPFLLLSGTVTDLDPILEPGIRQLRKPIDGRTLVAELRASVGERVPVASERLSAA